MKFISSKNTIILSVLTVLSGCTGLFQGRRIPAQSIGPDDYTPAQLIETIATNDQIAQKNIQEINKLYKKKWTKPEEALAWKKFNSSQLEGEDSDSVRLLNQAKMWNEKRAELVDHLKQQLEKDPNAYVDVFSKNGLYQKKIDAETSQIPNLFDPKINSKFVIDELEAYALNSDGMPEFIYPIENLNYAAKLEIVNDMLKNRPLFARLSCNQEIVVSGKGKAPVRDLEFVLRHRKNPVAGNRKIIFQQKDLKCSLLFKENKEDPWAHGVSIITESSLYKDLSIGKSVHEVCLFEKKEKFTSPYDFFSNLSYSSMSCMHKDRNSQILKDPIEAFQTKMIALTGSRLPEDVLTYKNVDYELDFSKAPKLDTILLAYLEFKADFAGFMIGKALKYHADKGAAIRILIPRSPVASILKKRDEAHLDKLVKYNSNIQYQKMVFNKKGGGLLHRFHRTLHTKMFITLSNIQPEANLIIEGGRNIKDTFIFRKMPDYSARPDMTQYGSEEPFTFMDDLEIMIRSREVAEQTAAQLLSFYYRDYKTMTSRATSQHLNVLSPTLGKAQEEKLYETSYIRHFISVPYVDNKEMEDIFVEMINSAQKTIHIVSPYMRPREKLAKAFLRAVERGVKIKFITRLNLEGDNVPGVAKDIYRDSVNKFYKNFEVYSWQGNMELGDSILHTKAVLVDERLLYMGGVNINNRSFTEDVESGFLISGKKTSQDFLNLYNNYYLKYSLQIQEKGSISLFGKVVLKILGPYF